MNILELVKKLYPFNYSVTGHGNDSAIEVMCSELDFDVHEYRSGQSLNGWHIPPEMTVIKAEIRKEGNLVYDGGISPLGVVSQTDNFQGSVTLDELKKHIFSDEKNMDAIPYHWSRLYRPNEPLWGFCVPASTVETWTDGNYDVDLRVTKSAATMKVLTYKLPGKSDDTILLHAHNCHPFQANDDISGVATGIRLMQNLSRISERRYSYVLMISPELFGPLYWLNDLDSKDIDHIKGAIMLKSVGNNSSLRLQQSFSGDSVIDTAAHSVMSTNYNTYDWGEFRTIYGNDETVFESPPFNIPSISLTRWPFPEYHTDRDTPDKIFEDRLADTVNTVFDICMALEMNICLKPCFKGLVNLSHYGLYKPVPPVESEGVNYSSNAGRWNNLMNALPRLMDRSTGLIEISQRYELPIIEVYEYVNLWIDEGLAEAC
jgi:aminopeptidase-like protein